MVGKKVSNPNISQVQSVINKFGGVPELVRALNESGYEIRASSVRRWRDKNRALQNQGLIPAAMWAPILKAARLYGILLTVQDMDMRNRGIKDGNTAWPKS